MSRGSKYQNLHERRLMPQLTYSSLTKLSPVAARTTTTSCFPHGGYRGITEQYPLSINTFDKPVEYIENVKNSVRSQYVDEENERSGSPEWVPRYNSDINHTGEQPLIVQHFLSGNKQEQRNGVLPAHVEVVPRLKPASYRHREERPDYHHGNSTHQYLTATEMPGQSHQLFDIRHGRPTRTSLLRTRHRSRSAPGVRALLEVDHLHKHQQLAAKTEDRFKSVDIPKDLQPLTESGETLHQFIIGARYNRNVFRDVKCLAATGIGVSRRGQHFPNGGSIDNENQLGYLTSRSDSSASIYLQNSSHPPLETKQAWGSDPALNKSRPLSRNGNVTTPAPTPINSVRDAFPTSGPNSSQEPQLQSTTGAKTIIDGRTLHSGHRTAGGCQDCVLCRKGVLSKGMPGTFCKKMDPLIRTDGSGHDAGDNVDTNVQGVGKERTVSDTVGHQLVQQYHLRILGIKMGVDEVRSQTPTHRTKLHYTTDFTKSAAVSASKSQGNQNKNNNRRSSAGAEYKTSSTKQKKDKNANNDEAQEDKSSMRSSMISVRISTHSMDNEDILSEPTPRDEIICESTSRGENGHQGKSEEHTENNDDAVGESDKNIAPRDENVHQANNQEQTETKEDAEMQELQPSGETVTQGACELQGEQSKDENGNQRSEQESGEQKDETNSEGDSKGIVSDCQGDLAEEKEVKG